MYRNEEPESQKIKVLCEQCGREMKSLADLILDDDGDWRCWSCRTSNRKERRSWRGQKCDVMGCTLTVQDHIDEFRRIVNSDKWDQRFGSKRDQIVTRVEEVPF